MTQPAAPLTPPRVNALGIPETATPDEARALLERLATSLPHRTAEELDAHLDAVAPVGPDFPALVDELITTTRRMRDRGSRGALEGGGG